MRNKSSTPTPFAEAISELEVKLTGVRQRREAIIAERISFERKGESPIAKSRELANMQADALKMLNGSAEGKIPSTKRRTLADVLDEQAVLDRAIEIGGRLMDELRIKAKAELAEARLPQYQALVKQQALNLIAVERTAQAMDELAKGTNLTPFAIPALGRLANTASPIYTFLDRCVRGGFFSAKELTSEFDRARKGLWG